MTRDEMKSLVEQELASIVADDRRNALADRLIDPSPHMRECDYRPGSFECWTVADDVEGPFILVYCSEGIGGRWGSLFRDSETLQMDSEWFASLDDAFISGMWKGLLPEDYEAQ